MYVKCINIGVPSNYIGSSTTANSDGLTLGKVYKVTGEERTKYRIYNDLGINRVYWKERFEVVGDNTMQEQAKPKDVGSIWQHHKGE